MGQADGPIEELAVGGVSTSHVAGCSFGVWFRVGERLQSFEEVPNLFSSPFFSELNAAALVFNLVRLLASAAFRPNE